MYFPIDCTYCHMDFSFQHESNEKAKKKKRRQRKEKTNLGLGFVKTVQDILTFSSASVKRTSDSGWLHS